jgi:hypothetical protein
VGDPAPMNVLDWRDQIFAALKQAEIRQVGYVPDAGHARLIELCRADPEMRAVPLTSEEEGIALHAVDDENLPLPADDSKKVDSDCGIM